MQSVLIVFLLIALALDLSLIVFAATRQDSKRSIYFISLTSFLLIYTLGYLLEIMCVTPEAAMTALQVENLGIPMIAPFFLLTTLSLFRPKALKPWMLPTVLAYGFTMFIIVLFNGYHHLYYTSVTMVSDGADYFVALARGPLYVVQQAVSMACMFISYIFIFSRFIKGNKKLRGQMSYFIIGSLIAFAANILNFSGVLPTGFDPTPFALAVGLLFASIDIFKHRLLDIVAFASNMAVATMDDAMVVVDNDWGFVFCNRRAIELFPPLAAFDGTEPVVGVEGWPYELAPRDTAGQVTFAQQGAGGEKKHVYRANISKMTIAQGRQIGWSIVIRDISEMTSLMEQLEEMATIDPLTGIYNRRHFLDLVETELKKAQRYNVTVGIIMYDLDNFKNINDEYGHAAGDLVLRETVDAVKGQLRSYDIFARYGGEEFVIFTSYKEEDGMRSFAERLRGAIERARIKYNDAEISITASFGVAKIPPGCSFDEAMLAADTALYQAKEDGRNRVVTGGVEGIPDNF